MANLTHPFDPDSLYEVDDDGNVRVSNGNSVGVFDSRGVYITGDIRMADPQMCNWVTNNPPPDGQLAKSRLAGRDDDIKTAGWL